MPAAFPENVRVQEKESFRPDDDVRALLRAALRRVPWADKSKLMNAALRHALAPLAGKSIDVRRSGFEKEFFNTLDKEKGTL